MRWNTHAPKEAQPWKRWFAWHPINMGHWTGDWLWLETVERRKHYPFETSKYPCFYEYRLITQENKQQ